MKRFLCKNLYLLHLLIASISVCTAYKPILRPEKLELVINEGDPLEITCESISDIAFCFPEDDTLSNIKTSEHEIIHERGDNGVISDHKFKLSKFQRNNSVFGDTGWYGCVSANADLFDACKNKNFDDPQVAWTYVYVKSKISPFVGTKEQIHINGVKGEDVIVPCRTTSPDIHVDLFDVHNDQVETLSDNLLYDPKIGFTIVNVKWIDNQKFYKCKTIFENNEKEITYILNIRRPVNLKKPTININNLKHVTKGQSLHINCSTNVGPDVPYTFVWKTPKLRSSNTKLHEKKQGLHSKYVTSEYIIDEVSYEDQGEYSCSVKSFGQMQSSPDRYYIRIYDPSITYINLSSHNYDSRSDVVEFGSPVQWFVNVDGYPEPRIRWLDTKGQEIFGTPHGHEKPHYVIETSEKQSSLKILQANFEDIGTYYIEAENGKETRYLNFTLEVKARPLATLIAPYENYYKIGERAEFLCDVAGYPTPNITWYVDKCPMFPLLVDCKTELLPKAVSKIITQSRVEGKVSVNVEMSGWIKCKACNDRGCEVEKHEILVSDTGEDLKILQSLKSVTVGDDISIICSASIYNFTNNMAWLNDKEDPIVNNDHFQLSYEPSKFNHRSILHIKDVKKTDGFNYVCKAMTIDGNFVDVSHNLKVYDPEPPFFTKKMNESEMTIIRAVDRRKSIFLHCFVGGRPTPNITWYKDDQVLKTSSQFVLHSNDQELEIKDLFERDSGKYSCVARNRFGKIESYQKFLVKAAEVSVIWYYSIVFLVVTLIIAVSCFCIKLRHEQRMRKELIAAGLMHFEEGAIDCLNPDLTVDDQAELLPYDRRWEFPREKLKLGKQLGSGAFGVVMKGEAKNIRADEPVTTVAIKMVRRDAEAAYIRALASELKIMVHLGKHLNVVNLLGACTQNIAKRELLVIVEYCRFGSMDKYLLRNRKTFINQIDPETGRIDQSIGSDIINSSSNTDNRSSIGGTSTNGSLGTETVIYTTDTQEVSGFPESGFTSNESQPGWRSNYRGDYKDQHVRPICTQDLLSWGFQVARGMEYLSQRKVLHGDLAARNILLAENNIVKICDFGLAKTMYKDDNYQKKGDGPVPVKWMAIESIRDNLFSTQSDVWSFGIVLWEFFTLAGTPYPGMQPGQQYQKLIEGYRMEQPKYATQEIYDVMLKCWKAKPSLRPSFTDLVNSIGDLLDEGVRTHYVDLNVPYSDMNVKETGEDYLEMMSAPDHSIMVSPEHEYVNNPQNASDSAYLSTTSGSPKEESQIFSPRPSDSTNNKFQFPANGSVSPTHSDSDENFESDPMLKSPPEQLDPDDYLKPIDVRKKREEFVKNREAEKRREESERNSKRISDRDSGYCNTPKDIMKICYVDDDARDDEIDGDDKLRNSNSGIEVNNYVNVNKDQNLKSSPDSFLNPSYIFMEDNKKISSTIV